MEKVKDMIPNSSLMAIAAIGITGATAMNNRKENKWIKNKVKDIEDKMKSVIRILDKNSLDTEDAQDILNRIKKQQKQINKLEDRVDSLAELIHSLSQGAELKDLKKEASWLKRELYEEEVPIMKKSNKKKYSSESEEESEDEMLRQVKLMM